MRALTALAIALTCSHASANDGFGALGAGGLMVGKTDAIAMAKEVLDVGYDRITVSYDFMNESDKNVTSLIVFPLPPYPASPNQSGVVSYGQPYDFEVKVNGKEEKFATRVRAIRNGKDITDSLKTLGFNEKQIAAVPLLLDKNVDIPKGLVLDLKQAGFLNDQEMPDWDVHVDYEWKQTFPARTSLHVEHSYRPFVAEGTASGYHPEYEEQINEFCVSGVQKNMLNTLWNDETKRDAYGMIEGTIVEYILTTANTWKDGIRDFTLRIHLGSNHEIISTCYPEGLHKINDRLYEVNIKNFRPAKDLSLYFGNTHIAASPGSGLYPQFH